MIENLFEDSRFHKMKKEKNTYVAKKDSTYGDTYLEKIIETTDFARAIKDPNRIRPLVIIKQLDDFEPLQKNILIFWYIYKEQLCSFRMRVDNRTDLMWILDRLNFPNFKV